MGKPEYIDVMEQLPSANPQWLEMRELASIYFNMAHYSADVRAATATQEEEIAHLAADARFHIQKDWTPPKGVHGFGLMYHYAVFQSGRIYKTQPETLITWNCTYGNPKALATVCILAPGEEPSAAMVATVKGHFDYLCFERPDLANLVRERTYGHGETPAQWGGGPDFGNSTPCPGRLLYFVRQYRAGQLAPPVGGQAQPPPPPPPGEHDYFPQTGHYVSHGFRDYYRGLGERALELFGYPLSEEVSEGGLTVQYFERAVFEFHAEAADPYKVQLRRLGAMALAGEQPGGCGCG